jgi:glycosyltransferase-like protein
VKASQTFVAPSPPAETLEERVFAAIDDLEAGLSAIADDVDVFHTQDCISARAAARVRDAGATVKVVRTVHHVDDFTTTALIECQRKAIEEPDSLVVVSEDWRNRLKTDYGVDATVIHNGVDARRFGPIDPARRAALRSRAGLRDRFVFLSVGGIEPRKGSIYLFQAMALLAADIHPAPALVVVGGHSFQDYTRYRDDVLATLPGLGLRLGRDVILAGSIGDDELHEWYRSADALVFPSTKEGWGLAVLEALAADLPVVSSDIAVLREYLTPDATAVMTRVGDPVSLAEGMSRVVRDASLRETLVRGGRSLVPAFSWQRAADEHASVYAQLPA